MLTHSDAKHVADAL